MLQVSALAAPMTPPPTATHGWPDRLLLRITQFSTQRPMLVLALASLMAVGSWLYASQLRIEGSFVALLPTDSPTAHRFQETLDRKAGGNSTLIVMVRSDNQEDNRRFVDQLSEDLSHLPQSQVYAVEKGPGEAQAFFEKWKWLFASEYDLALLKCRVEQERAKRSPGYLGLEDTCEDSVVVPEREGEVAALPAAPSVKSATDSQKDATKPAVKESQLEKFERQLEERLEALDRYPTGYFQDQAGTTFSIMIRAPSAGMGEFKSDELFRIVQEKATFYAREFPNLEIGYAGDIPNAIEQRDALISDMATISLIAVALILGSIIIFFRSVISLLQIGFCVTIGCGLSFAVAMAAYGRLNTATSFLGAIIAGNGINYGIIYLTRYRELRSEQVPMALALERAALSSRKGTWLAALAAGGAYSALLLTSFRGFSEFGLIGGVGMVFSWLATFIVLPAQISLVERWLPGFAQRQKPTLAIPLHFVARLAERRTGLVLWSTLFVTIAAAYPLREYLKDPWEYNFSQLGSQSSKKSGAGRWSKSANKVFRSRGSPMLVMAEEASQVLGLKSELLRQDKRVTDGAYIERIETIYDRLGGSPEVVSAKLELLREIRQEIDSVLPRLKAKDAEIAKRWRPPEYLRALDASDLPDLIRSQFTEKDGTVGTPLYVYLNRGISQSDGHNLMRIADIFESVKLPSGEIAPNASRSTVFAAMIRAMERDGPLATLVAFLTVTGVIIIVTRRVGSVLAILSSLLCGVILTVGGAAWLDVRLNFLNFVALPLTFGIGVEYAINLYERIRATGNIEEGVSSIGGAVVLCSVTTMLGYGSLIMADNMALQSFGRYAIAGEIACIVTAMIVMPAWLIRFGKGRYQSAPGTNPRPPEASS